MILAIWEGTPHRQMLDGLEVMERKRAHRALFDRLAPLAPAQDLQQMESRLERHFRLSPDEREAQAESLFHSLAAFTASALARK